jgi:hypothetical protein
MSIRHSQRNTSGFQIHSLSNEAVSVSIAPELGGRIVSLRDRISGREWLDGWSPVGKRRIWHPTDPANFETGPGAGLDECLPTVLPCKIKRRSLPDHGDLWNQVPEFIAHPKSGFFCHWDLHSLPLAFERRICLRKNEVRFDYQLENLADTATPFLVQLETGRSNSNHGEILPQPRRSRNTSMARTSTRHRSIKSPFSRRSHSRRQGLSGSSHQGFRFHPRQERRAPLAHLAGRAFPLCRHLDHPWFLERSPSLGHRADQCTGGSSVRHRYPIPSITSRAS